MIKVKLIAPCRSVPFKAFPREKLSENPVVYFDQLTGASGTIRWLKSTNHIFFNQKQKKEKKHTKRRVKEVRVGHLA